MAAQRLKRPSWKDPRLLIGILLVLASVAAVVALVRSLDRTTSVYVAREDIAVGQRISVDDLAVRKVRLGVLESRYLTPAAGLPQHRHAQQLIHSGDLVPKSALDTADALDRKPVGLSVAEPLPDGAHVGSLVDVWVAKPDGPNGYREPVRVLIGAEISGVQTSSSALGAATDTRVHVLVDDERLPRLLAARANEAKIALVWNPAGTGP